MDILDILTPKGSAGVGQYFTPASGAPYYVAVTHYGAQAEVECDNSAGQSLFANGDNFLLVAAGFAVPEGFTLSTPARGAGKYMLPKLSMYLYPETVGSPVYHHKLYPLFAGYDAAAGNGTVFVPFENFEYLLNIFVNVNSDTFYDATAAANVTGVTGKFGLYIGIDEATISISMANVPGVLVGTPQMIMPFVKVSHNAQLTS